MDHSSRIDLLRRTIDGTLLVTRLPNIRYLTGFTGSNAFLLATPDAVTFITDGRYGEAAEALLGTLPGMKIEVYQGSMWPTLRRLLGDVGDPVSLEAHDVSWDFAREVERSGVEAVPVRGVVEDLRRAKDADEVEALRRAAAAGDAAFATLEVLAAAAPTEADLGWGLVGAMRAAGADQAGWEPIVAQGPSASLPHHRAGPAELAGGLLLLDYGCVVDGYHSDMSRTVWRDGDPDPEMAEIHRVVLASQEAGIAAVTAGVTGAEVDEACRAVLREHGYEEYFVHSTGHGVGLEIHEAPRLARSSEDVLIPGDVVTVEPGVYLPGRGGVRIEDMVLVTETGHEVLTRSSKELQPS
jgi:Xaa-Pro aminopeptidase